MTQRHSTNRSPFAARLRLEVCEERIVPAHAALLDVSATVDLVGSLAAPVHLDARLTADSSKVSHGQDRARLDHKEKPAAAAESGDNTEVSHGQDRARLHHKEKLAVAAESADGAEIAHIQADVMHDYPVQSGSAAESADSAEVSRVQAAVPDEQPAESGAAAASMIASGESAAPAARTTGGANESAPAYLQDSTTWMLDPGVIAMEVSIAAARVRVPPPRGGGAHGSGGDKGGEVSDIGPVNLKHLGETVVASADTHDHSGRPDDRGPGRGEVNLAHLPLEGIAADRTAAPTAVTVAGTWSIDHSVATPEDALAADDDETPPPAAPAAPTPSPVAAALQVAAAMQGVAPVAVTTADLLARFAPFDPKAAEESVDRFLGRLRSHRESGDWLTRRHVALIGLALAAGVSAGEVARRKQVPQRLSRFLSLTRTKPGTRTA